MGMRLPLRKRKTPTSYVGLEAILPPNSRIGRSLRLLAARNLCVTWPHSNHAQDVGLCDGTSVQHPTPHARAEGAAANQLHCEGGITGGSCQAASARRCASRNSVCCVGVHLDALRPLAQRQGWCEGRAATPAPAVRVRAKRASTPRQPRATATRQTCPRCKSAAADYGSVHTKQWQRTAWSHRMFAPWPWP